MRVICARTTLRTFNVLILMVSILLLAAKRLSGQLNDQISKVAPLTVMHAACPFSKPLYESQGRFATVDCDRRTGDEGRSVG
jgi:hypothetical protein